MRNRIPIVTITALFVLLGLGLFYTQIIRYGYYSRLSKNNSIRIIPIDGPRGSIFDRNGIPLVSNRLSFDAAVVYQELKNKPEFIRFMSQTLKMPGGDIARSLEKASRRPYAPVTILEDIDKEKALTLEEASFDIDGLTIETRSKRDYLHNNIASHLFGYLSEIGEPELEDLRDYGYRVRDLIGRSGIEKYYETYLKGVDGGTQVEVDSRGRQTRVLGLKEPSSGKDLYLTIDLSLQSACDKLLGERKGAVIVMNPVTGEVLALASHPSFDPNVFVKLQSQDQRAALLTDKIGRPLSDRAISGLYPPGSVFKIVTASAGLETKKINRNTRFLCIGSYRLGRAKFDCWKEGGHGLQDIVEALMNSCNVFFYNTGRAAGVDALESYATLYGFGQPTGIDLPDEVRGIVPGRAWKKFYRKDAWYEGETINYAIGQGYLMVTPIQILNMMGAIANKGSLVRPFVVRRVGDEIVQPVRPRSLGLKATTIDLIRQGLYDVVNNENGTGRRAKVDGVVAGGKTGTAENPLGRTHAWFVGFAPFDDPKICVVVFLEHGGKGGIGPADIAHGIFEEARKKGYI